MLGTEGLEKLLADSDSWCLHAHLGVGGDVDESDVNVHPGSALSTIESEGEVSANDRPIARRWGVPNWGRLRRGTEQTVSTNASQ